jgi:hypothetical protein
MSPSLPGGALRRRPDLRLDLPRLLPRFQLPLPPKERQILALQTKQNPHLLNRRQRRLAAMPLLFRRKDAGDFLGVGASVRHMSAQV